jgi:hypothetical protein
MKFSIGQKVRVYGMCSPASGGNVKYLEGAVGHIIKLDEGSGYTIKLKEPIDKSPHHDSPDVIDGVHPKQMRTLKASKIVTTVYLHKNAIKRDRISDEGWAVEFSKPPGAEWKKFKMVKE